jgi:nucleotide-binding universal stress UspA family protein
LFDTIIEKAGSKFYRENGGFMITKILVPSDGSKMSQKAAKYAAGLAKQTGSSIVLLSVIDKSSFIPQSIPAAATPRKIREPLEDFLKEASQAYLEDARQLCEKNGIQSRIVIRSGHPVEEIIKEAKKSNVDLIVIGSHGRSALKAALLGSVTFGVIHKDIKIPVLVVRR